MSQRSEHQRAAFRIRGRHRPKLTDLAPPLEARDHHAGYGRFQNSLRLRQGIIQRRAFFQFFFVQRRFIYQQPRCGATLCA